MAKVVAFIRCSPTAQKASVRFRIIDAKKVDASHTSEIFIEPENFDKVTQTYKPKANVSSKVRMDFDRQIFERKELLLDIYDNADKNEKLSSAWFNSRVLERINELVKDKSIEIAPSKAPAKTLSFEVPYLTDTFADFVQKSKISDVRKKNYRVILRTLQRYELYVCNSRNKNRIELNDITAETLIHIEYFFKNENEIAKDYPKLYQEIPESRQPKPRGDNTISDMMWIFRIKTPTFSG